MIVDLHMHSTRSDGTYPLPELAALCVADGLDAFAVTDHDCVGDTALLRSLCPDSLRCLPGIEITCREEPFPGCEPCSVHLLGYGFDEHNPALLARLERRTADLSAAFAQLAEDLGRRFGMVYRPEEVPKSCGRLLLLRDVTAFLPARFPNHPRLEDAYALIASCFAPIIQANLSMEEAAALLHGAGGVAVWAHPFDVYRRFGKTDNPPDVLPAMLDKLVSMGLDGVEAEYLAYSPEQRDALCRLAEERGLFTTAGSDFHGVSRRHTFINFDIRVDEALLARLGAC